MIEKVPIQQKEATVKAISREEVLILKMNRKQYSFARML